MIPSAYVPCYNTDLSRRELLALADRLNLDKHQALGIWLTLNHWCQSNAKTGNISGLPATTLAAAAGLDPRSGQRFADALKEAGLVDDTGQLTDWELYGGRILLHRQQKAESMRRLRQNSPPRGGNVATTRQPQSGNKDTTLPPPLTKERKESSYEDSNGAGGAESHALTHEQLAKIEAILPGATAAAADVKRFERIVHTFPDVDHLFELQKMAVKLGEPGPSRSWAERYISWVTDGKSVRYLDS